MSKPATASVTRFSSLGWSPGGHPLEQKRVGDDRHLVLLRFQPGFVDPHRCTRSHVLVVQEGVLTVELDDETLELHPGDALRLPRGTGHRAQNRGTSDVLVLAVSDIDFVSA